MLLINILTRVRSQIYNTCISIWIFPYLYQGSAGICQWIRVSGVRQPVREDGWEQHDVPWPGKTRTSSTSDSNPTFSSRRLFAFRLKAPRSFFPREIASYLLRAQARFQLILWESVLFCRISEYINAVFAEVNGRLMGGMINCCGCFRRHAFGKYTYTLSKQQNEISFWPSQKVTVKVSGLITPQLSKMVEFQKKKKKRKKPKTHEQHM